MRGKPGSFEGWQESVHRTIRERPLWGFAAYQKALFLYDLAWYDCEHLMRDVRGRAASSQLIRSVGSISANMEEAYGRGKGKDYRFHMRIALAEAREAQGWYWRSGHLLPDNVCDHRLNLLDEIIAILTTHLRRHHD
ncbi:MAG: four helix bundle protein [Anaerolineae bacterium]|nr:four helix bundle protein [Anaerolineae bacterium]